jgi:TraY domain
MAKGPAPRGEYVGKSSVFSTRIRPDLRKKLEQAAKRTGRSLSQEVEHRLNRSFIEDDKIAETFGDRRTFILMRMMADAIHFGHERANLTWLDNPIEFEKAISAALLVLEAIRPEGDVPPDALPTRHYQVQGERAAFNIWRAIKRADPSLPLNRGTNADHRHRFMKDGLGGLADRALEDDNSADSSKEAKR